MMLVSFIVNAQAGNFKGRKVWHNTREQLTIAYEVYETAYKGHVIELVQQIATSSRKEHLIVVIGGDGTIHEAVNGAADFEHVTLAYMKAGSGNDFARAFMYFDSAAQIEAYVKNADKTVVDCGVVHYNLNEEKRFINNFGIGFDAFVSMLVNESRVKKALNKIGLGKLSYAYFVAQGLMQFKPFTLILETDDGVRTFDNVWFVTASNQPFFGGGMNLSPTSIVDDGVFEITVVNHLPRLKFLAVFLTVFAGTHTRFKEVTQLQATFARFEVDALLPIHTDGETEMLTQHEVYCNLHKKSIFIAK